MKRFRYTPSVLVSIGLMVVGLAFVATLLARYVANDFSLPPATSNIDHLAVTGILFIIIGFSIFGFTLLLHATNVRYGSASASPSPKL
jgi:hypothetical protein